MDEIANRTRIRELQAPPDLLSFIWYTEVGLFHVRQEMQAPEVMATGYDGWAFDGPL